MADLCTIERRKLRTRSTLNMVTGESTPGESFWETGPCGTPLFGEAERAAGECRACAKGWTHPHNYPTAEGPPVINLMCEQPPCCRECGARVELGAEPAGADHDGPFYAGQCPTHGLAYYQDEPESDCPELDGLGFEPELGGGGAVFLSLYFAGAGHIWATLAEGQGMPESDNFAIGYYPPGWDGDSIELRTSAGELSLFDAAELAISEAQRDAALVADAAAFEAEGDTAQAADCRARIGRPGGAAA